MKARVIATGEIIDETAMVSTLGDDFYLRELEPISENTEVIDYWARLEHQYAGMAMWGIMANQDLIAGIIRKRGLDDPIKLGISDLAMQVATTLVQKLKEKEERK